MVVRGGRQEVGDGLLVQAVLHACLPAGHACMLLPSLRCPALRRHKHRLTTQTECQCSQASETQQQVRWVHTFGKAKVPAHLHAPHIQPKLVGRLDAVVVPGLAVALQGLQLDGHNLLWAPLGRRQHLPMAAGRGAGDVRAGSSSWSTTYTSAPKRCGAPTHGTEGCTIKGCNAARLQNCGCSITVKARTSGLSTFWGLSSAGGPAQGARREARSPPCRRRRCDSCTCCCRHPGSRCTAAHAGDSVPLWQAGALPARLQQEPRSAMWATMWALL